MVAQMVDALSIFMVFLQLGVTGRDLQYTEDTKMPPGDGATVYGADAAGVMTIGVGVTTAGWPGTTLRVYGMPIGVT